MARRVSLVSMLFLLGWVALAPLNAQDPGTTGDPLVSKSYLEHFFRFRSLVVPDGDTLSLVAGALVVARSGKLRVRAPKGKALIDLTDGKEIPADAMLPPNHLVLVPDSAAYALEAKGLSLVLAMGLHPEK